ncbi:dienelactone hydrolase family protein [Pusillimonas sp. ANT_WB101]|uniref:dienelactone hydrolase family protein n=1 Tax=Pusillimonas sp. ANT_WB101 TaxID=2597356 RepID=UPI0011ED6261|nr:dienelactone hydrolase family protein [Pusillimonas sp. ANT_WB101]KAA0888503.1 dienelactone hydrolase family protein [Pusillimonas sp. ANT_WB101]
MTSPSIASITSSTDTTVHTTADGLRHGMVDIACDNGPIQGYYAVPEGQTNPPLVLVIQEIFGVHDHIKDVCRRLAHEGYMAVAPELYQRQGDASKYGNIQALIRDVVAKVPDEQVLADLDAAVRWAESHGADTARLVATGFCWGGRLVWLYAAHNPTCNAAVAWYGRLARGHGPLQTRNPIDVAPMLHAPVLGLYGGKDDGIPLDEVKSMESALEQGGPASQMSQIVVYPEANHAFFADYRPSYRADDAHDAWGKMLAWFERYLVE